ALAFRIDDHAAAEFRMHHVLPDPESPGAAAVAESLCLGRLALADSRAARAVPRTESAKRLLLRPPFRNPRREPFQESVGNLVEEARRQVVASLAVQHARLRERQVQALPRA